MAIESQGPNGQGGMSGILDHLNVDDAQQMMDQTREVVDQALSTAGEFIRERPIICLAGALAIGYVIGKIVSR
jgi:ElaB/YqjD/DUF883 family membrane-anchored ribosome-binding protein